MLLRATALSAANFRHAFTTRSAGDFATLRNGAGGPGPLREWQEALAREVGFERARFFQTKQVHGRTVVDAEGDPKDLLAVSPWWSTH